MNKETRNILIGIVLVVIGIMVFQNIPIEQKPLSFIGSVHLEKTYSSEIPFRDEIVTSVGCGVNNPEGDFFDFKSGYILLGDGIFEQGRRYLEVQVNPYAVDYFGGIYSYYHTIYDVVYKNRDTGEVVKNYLFTVDSDNIARTTPDMNTVAGCEYVGCDIYYNIHYCPLEFQPNLDIPLQDVTIGFTPSEIIPQCLTSGDVAQFDEHFFICDNGVWSSITAKLIEDEDTINELQITLQEKAEIIESLNFSLEQQGEIIDTLQISIVEKANLINQLTANVEEQIIILQVLELQISEQADMINALTTNLQEKIILVSQLQVENEEQAFLISQMELSFSDQADIINALNKEISDDAEIIQNLNLNIEGQAKLISEMDLSIQEDAELIANLNLELSEEKYLVEKLSLELSRERTAIGELKSTIERQEELIEKITQEKTQLEKERKQLRTIILALVGVVALIVFLVWIYKKGKRR